MGYPDRNPIRASSSPAAQIFGLLESDNGTLRLRVPPLLGSISMTMRTDLVGQGLLLRFPDVEGRIDIQGLSIAVRFRWTLKLP
jgi:hypothetical protein